MIESCNPINSIPSEILCRIFSFLGPRDLACCAQVSTIWRQVIHDRDAAYIYKLYAEWVEIFRKAEKLKAENEGRVYREMGDRTPVSRTEWLQVSTRFLFRKIWQSTDPAKELEISGLDWKMKKLESQKESYKFIKALFGNYSGFENLPITHCVVDPLLYLGPMAMRESELALPVMRGELRTQRPYIALKVRFEPKSSGLEDGETTTMVYMDFGTVWFIGGRFRLDAPFVGERTCYNTVRTLLTIGHVEVNDDFKRDVDDYNVGTAHYLMGTYRIVS